MAIKIQAQVPKGFKAKVVHGTIQAVTPEELKKMKRIEEAQARLINRKKLK